VGVPESTSPLNPSGPWLPPIKHLSVTSRPNSLVWQRELFLSEWGIKLDLRRFHLVAAKSSAKEVEHNDERC
jgi:hypothetical protein